jgi:hypothetical protein
MSLKIIKVAIALAIVFLQTSCTCLMINGSGNRWLSLSPETMWSTEKGKRAIKCHLYYYQGANQHSLGTRFVFGTPDAWSRKIATAYTRAKHDNQTNPIDEVYLNIIVNIPKENEEIKDGFTFVSKELKIKQSDSILSKKWKLDNNKNPNPKRRCWFTTTHDGVPLTVYINCVSIYWRDREYKEWWWYPNQVLLAPAFVIDVVTLPIQLMYLSTAFGNGWR